MVNDNLHRQTKKQNQGANGLKLAFLFCAVETFLRVAGNEDCLFANARGT